jgi:hypothetical protein
MVRPRSWRYWRSPPATCGRGPHLLFRSWLRIPPVPRSRALMEMSRFQWATHGQRTEWPLARRSTYRQRPERRRRVQRSENKSSRSWLFNQGERSSCDCHRPDNAFRRRRRPGRRGSSESAGRTNQARFCLLSAWPAAGATRLTTLFRAGEGVNRKTFLRQSAGDQDRPRRTGMSMGLPPRTTVMRTVWPGWCFSTSVRSSSRVRTRLCSTATMRSADS